MEKSTMANLINKISMTYTYESWSPEYKADFIKKQMDDFYDRNSIDFNKLSREELLELGFVNFDKTLYLFPLWVVPFIPEGMKVVNIFGSEVSFSHEMDLDTRFGCVSFGINLINIEELVTSKTNYFELTNSLTEEMDNHLLNNNDNSMRTYIYDNPVEGKWLIRFPGATRGSIEVDEDMIITKIALYKDECNTHSIYSEDVTTVFRKYIGMRLVINK